MNTRATGKQSYVPTEVEHLANIITHAVSVVPSLLGLMLLLKASNNRPQYFSSLVYGMALVALFTISTTFHSVFYSGRFRSLKDVLHRCDRAVIYVFIAASYTPWLILKEMHPGSWANYLRWLVWLLAVLGIVYQHYYHERYKTLETLFYLIIGVLPALSVFSMRESSGVMELMLGGCVYIIGIGFFKADGCIPCAHAIWHLFVNIGATCHYYAVYTYLLEIRPELSIEES